MRFSLVFLLGVLGVVMLTAGCESTTAAEEGTRQTISVKRGDRNHRHVPRHRHCRQHDHH